MSDTNRQKREFEDQIQVLLKDEVSFKITFSKPRHQNKEVGNAYLKPSVIKKQNPILTYLSLQKPG
ncbi:MAG: hypothetical protein IPP49_10865 [Saprospiraceae bacterium]|nr:hypothetical protein [Saprospiraceae bacterium]